MTKCRLRIFRMILEHGSITAKDIKKNTGISGRTVSSCLQQLRKYNMIGKRPNFNDMRMPYYYIKDLKW